MGAFPVASASTKKRSKLFETHDSRPSILEPDDGLVLSLPTRDPLWMVSRAQSISKSFEALVVVPPPSFERGERARVRIRVVWHRRAMRVLDV